MTQWSEDNSPYFVKRECDFVQREFGLLHFERKSGIFVREWKFLGLRIDYNYITGKVTTRI
jgi:hypothetical protein